MTSQIDRARLFLELHHGDAPLIMPNAWDRGSAAMLASLGCRALATTSSGFAATLARRDGDTTRDEALEHCAALVEAVDVPVSADLENGYCRAPEEVADTVAEALDAGLAGCSIEDYAGRADDVIYDRALAAERVEAAVEAAHGGDVHMVVTARAENHLYGRDDLDDTIARLHAYQQAGADVLYAPGFYDLDTVARIVGSVDLPVNVLVWPGGPTIAELAGAGVARISVGGALAFAAYGAAVEAAREMLDSGTCGFWDLAASGGEAARRAFGPRPTG